MSRSLTSALGLCGLVISGTACSAERATGVEAIYSLPSSLDALSGEAFLDHPFPSHFRTESGSPVYRGMYNPRGTPLVEQYIDSIEGVLDGFSTVGAGYLRFAGAVDVSSLPADESASLQPRSSVQLVNVDATSERYLSRHPIAVSFRREGGHFVLPNTLRWIPAFGFPLEPATRYAIVTTGALRAEGGGATRASQGLRQMLGLEPSEGAIAAHRDAVRTDLDALTSLGLRRELISHLSVFTTADPTGELLAVRDHLHQHVAAPSFEEGQWQQHIAENYVEYQGVYGPSPNYQAGTVPFSAPADGGALNFDAAGEPAVVDTFDLRFSLTVPLQSACAMPDDGYPIVLYAHGTGGNFRSYINAGVARDMAGLCVATMGVDQIFHGTRPGSPGDKQATQILFFNFENIIAARSNTRQSAIDEVQRARLFTSGQGFVPADVSYTDKAIRFDPARITFFGHSQGGLNGPLFLAVDDAARGGVLSGAGSVIAITLIEKTKPVPSIAGLVRTVFLQLGDDESQELDVFHPALSLAQAIIDPVDPVNYAALLIDRPRDGFAPKSIYMTEGIGPDGIGDSYTPPLGTEALAIATGLPLQRPVQYRSPLLAWAATEISVPPQGLAGHLADGKASGVLAQWAPADADGHFVVFNVPAARQQASLFLLDLLNGPAGRVRAPQ
jgi:hypothetical protein